VAAAIDAKYTSNQFTVTFDGMPEETLVQSVTGIGWELETAEEAQTGMGAKRFRPGRLNYNDISIERLYGTDRFFSDWMALNASPVLTDRKSGQINLLDRAGEVIGTWEIRGAFISKWSISDQDSGSDDVMKESVEIAIEELVRTA